MDGRIIMCLLEIFYFEINELANGSSASSVISILTLIASIATTIATIFYAKKTLDNAEENLKIARETLGITKQDIEERITEHFKSVCDDAMDTDKYLEMFAPQLKNMENNSTG